MPFLYFLEKLRLPGLNELMLGITLLGEETAFFVIALVMFWCVDKRRGYYIMAIGIFGTLINQFLKLLCRIPRPWVLDERFTILEPARAGATGYSFPSGHTQSAVGIFGGIAYTEERKWLRTVCVVLAVLVPFSRMYVGVHTPYDVLASVFLALALILALRPVAIEGTGKGLAALLVGMAAAAIAYTAYAMLFPFPEDMDAANLASGQQTGWTLLGVVLGLLAVYAVDEKWIHFPVEACWWAQCLKVGLGLALVVALKEGLKIPEGLIFHGHLAGRAIRYFIVIIAAGMLWPLSFSWFSTLGEKKKEKQE